MVHVSCGLHHTAAVDTDGAVWCWGDSSHGQCGTGSSATYFTPQKMTLASDQSSKDSKLIKCREVHCGAEHTVALTSKGELWSWGKGRACALSAGHTGSLSPRPIEYLHGRTVIAVQCGYYHTMALVEKLSSQDRLRLSESLKVAERRNVPVATDDEQRFESGDPLGVTGSRSFEPNNVLAEKSEKNFMLGNLKVVDESENPSSAAALNETYTLLTPDDREDVSEKQMSRNFLQGVVPVSVQGYGYVKEMTRNVMSNIVTSMQRVSTVVRPVQKAKEPTTAGGNGDADLDVLLDGEVNKIFALLAFFLVCIRIMCGSVVRTI